MDEKTLFKVLSILLDYPDGDFRELLKHKEELIKENPYGETLGKFLQWAEGLSDRELEEFYVSTFDFSTKYTLYLTYHRYGDDRDRGKALADLKGEFLKEGLEPKGELPDYLPLLLEFASLENTDRGREILGGYLKELEKIHKNLAEDNNPYAHLLEVLLSVLKGDLQKAPSV